jgi:phosphoribosylanthranilate isomerase
MSLRIKICGITNEADALAALEAGADALGFITYPPSPRHLDIAAAAPWISRLPPLALRVAVVVNEPLARLREWSHFFPVDAWQFHGHEEAAAIEQLRVPRRIKVLRLDALPARSWLETFDVQAFLLDTPAHVLGGSGKTMDWELAAQFVRLSPRPVILAGGLTPDNVAEAIRRVRPYGVDVASGVEAAPGKKDHAKLRAFIQAARSA